MPYYFRCQSSSCSAVSSSFIHTDISCHVPQSFPHARRLTQTTPQTLTVNKQPVRPSTAPARRPSSARPHGGIHLRIPNPTTICTEAGHAEDISGGSAREKSAASVLFLQQAGRGGSGSRNTDGEHVKTPPLIPALQVSVPALPFRSASYTLPNTARSTSATPRQVDARSSVTTTCHPTHPDPKPLHPRP